MNNDQVNTCQSCGELYYSDYSVDMCDDCAELLLNNRDKKSVKEKAEEFIDRWEQYTTRGTPLDEALTLLKEFINSD